jgi:hypothetical protein
LLRPRRQQRSGNAVYEVQRRHGHKLIGLWFALRRNQEAYIYASQSSRSHIINNVRDFLQQADLMGIARKWEYAARDSY